MTDLCDLCRVPALEEVYEPHGGGRGLKVYVCTHCGLVQSLPRADRAPRAAPAVSAGADWGNLRYGKGFRTEACLSMIRAHADLTDKLSLLDVGSNRGSFARAFIAAAPRAHALCVEPDERVAESCATLERTELIRARIEDVEFPDASFDVIHSCHTIEHLASPHEVLARHWCALREGGLLVVDAPNIAIIGTGDIIEEWFIDKHLYHYSRVTLSRLLSACGFEIVDGPELEDRENLLFAARKRNMATRPARHDPAETEWAQGLIATYVRNRARNLAALAQVACKIASMAHKRVALWGAGRLFDALVVHGGFDPRTLVALIDTHLKAHVAERHGMALSGPEALTKSDPGVIVIMSRAFAAEIAGIAKAQAPRADILFYADLLTEARKQRAA